MLSQQTIDIVKAITPAVGANAEAITTRFYELMFEGNPEVQAYFNQVHQKSGEQPKALAGSICAYFSNIDNLPVLAPAVEVIAQKHCSLNVKPEHYPIVGKHLLAAIQEVMGDAATDEIMSAVEEAYGTLAEVCIGREEEIYDDQKNREGGWNGFRSFKVERKEAECENVASFYLRPEDGGASPQFTPGQFITVKIDDTDPPTSPRNYSLSDSPENDLLRISVKKELSTRVGCPHGLVSTYLHENVNAGEVIQVGPPCGEFTIDPANFEERPVVFLAAGIGVTPLLSMAKALIDELVLSPIYFLHAVQNSACHPFRDEVQQMISDKDFVDVRFLYDQPLEGDVENGRCDEVGQVSTELLKKWTPYEEADYYFCGPKPFMQSVYASLKELGVDDARIHFEFFGPKQEIASASGA